MNLDLNVIATGLVAPIAVLLVKILLDFSLAHYFVKYFWWLPVRSLFRDHPPKIAGKWEQAWGAADSPSFQQSTDRHSYTDIKQFGCYIYAEFDAKGQTYCLFGKIRGSYVVAEWYDKSDRHAYFGAAQFRIINSKILEGRYIGHSQRTGLVGSDEWKWQKH